MNHWPCQETSERLIVGRATAKRPRGLLPVTCVPLYLSLSPSTLLSLSYVHSHADSFPWTLMRAGWTVTACWTVTSALWGTWLAKNALAIAPLPRLCPFCDRMPVYILNWAEAVQTGTHSHSSLLLSFPSCWFPFHISKNPIKVPVVEKWGSFSLVACIFNRTSIMKVPSCKATADHGRLGTVHYKRRNENQQKREPWSQRDFLWPLRIGELPVGCCTKLCEQDWRPTLSSQYRKQPGALSWFGAAAAASLAFCG